MGHVMHCWCIGWAGKSCLNNESWFNTATSGSITATRGSIAARVVQIPPALTYQWFNSRHPWFNYRHQWFNYRHQWFRYGPYIYFTSSITSFTSRHAAGEKGSEEGRCV